MSSPGSMNRRIRLLIIFLVLGFAMTGLDSEDCLHLVNSSIKLLCSYQLMLAVAVGREGSFIPILSCKTRSVRCNQCFDTCGSFARQVWDVELPSQR